MSEKTMVVLAGSYPAGTADKIRFRLPEDSFDFRVVDSPEAYESMTDAEIIILRIFKGPESMMERNPKLKMIMRWGAGFDSVDIEAANRRGISVTNTPGANAGAVSELALLMMLAVGRKLLSHQASLHQGNWSKNDYINQSCTLNNRTVGIIGAGNIGRQVARKAQAFGAKTQYYDIYRLDQEREDSLSLPYVPLEELIRTSDLISLHIPLSKENYHLIGPSQFAAMKQGAILINTARGGLVDEKALLEAVDTGHLAGAGLDVVECEPLSADHPLLQNPNILVTPHVGGGTCDLGEVIIPMLVTDILDYSAGRPVMHVVNQPAKD